MKSWRANSKLPVVQYQVFVSAYWAGASSANSALSGENQHLMKIYKELHPLVMALPDASLSGLWSKLSLMISSVFHPQRLLTICFFESHTVQVFHRGLNLAASV